MDLCDAIDALRPSVVQFVAISATEDHVFGSGFILDDEGRVATAAHVIRLGQALGSRGFGLRIGIASPNAKTEIGDAKVSMRANFTRIGYAVSVIDEERDVACVIASASLAEPMNLVAFASDGEIVRPFEEVHSKCSVDSDRPREGEHVAVSGYPLRIPSMVTTSGHVASAWEEHRRSNAKPHDVYLADLSVNPGNSGGPVFRVADARVLGVCSAFSFAPLHYRDGSPEEVAVEGKPVGINAGLCVVAPIRHLLDAIESASPPAPSRP